MLIGIVSIAISLLALAISFIGTHQFTVWFASIGASVFFVAAVWVFGKRKGWTRYERYGGCGILVFLFVVIMYFIPLDQNARDSKVGSEMASEVISLLKNGAADEDSFHIETRIVVLSDANDRLLTPFMVAYKDKLGNVASPINFSLYVQVANKKNIRSKITTYSVEVGDSSNGPWKRLMPIIPPNNEFCWLASTDVTKVSVMRYDEDLVSVLRGSDFEPRETRNGWAFFERRDVVPSKSKFFKFHIRTATGEQTTQIVPAAAHAQGEVNVQLKMGRLIRTGKKLDMTKFRFKYFYSSYPSDA